MLLIIFFTINIWLVTRDTFNSTYNLTIIVINGFLGAITGILYEIYRNDED